MSVKWQINLKPKGTINCDAALQNVTFAFQENYFRIFLNRKWSLNTNVDAMFQRKGPELTAITIVDFNHANSRVTKIG